jgi:Co/Zn/Cd efflux system component
MSFLYFLAGVVCAAVVLWFFDPGFESKISPSDLFDSLVTLLVGLIITRKVAESQNQAAKRLSEKMQNAQQSSTNMRIEQNILIEQLQKDLIKIDRVFEVVDQHRFKPLTNDLKDEIKSTLRNLGSTPLNRGGAKSY